MTKLVRNRADVPPSATPEAGSDGAAVRLHRGPALVTALLATVGGAAAYLAPLPAELRASTAYGILFAVLGLLQIGVAVIVLVWPNRRSVLTAATGAVAALALWGASRAGVLPDPDPWQPVNSVIGFAGVLVAALQSVAVVLLVALAALGPRPRRSLPLRVLTHLGAVPLAAVVLAGVVVVDVAASDGFAGAGFPGNTVSPRDLAAGERSTVEYCRPAGIPLAMDIYTPPVTAGNGRLAPVVVYVHGGGMVLGDRGTIGLGATLANHEGALFPSVQRRLNERGVVVASIDYRLPPATAWPAQIEDAKCAVRYLRAHAASLRINPSRIGAWGSSAGATLSSLLGLAGPTSGFDIGQYVEQSSALQAVVDMFSPTDLTDLGDSSAFMRKAAWVGLGGSAPVRRAASPMTYVHGGAPPFLILHGTDDQDVRPRHSARFAEALHAAGVPVTYIQVQGAGHSMDAESQRPSPQQLSGTIADFLVDTLGAGGSS